MKVPGFIWTAILALIPLLIKWLGGDYFGEQNWAPWAVLALGFIAKLIEMAQPAASRPRVRMIGESDESKVGRFLWG